MKVKPILTKPENEFRWSPNGTYNSELIKGLNKIFFISNERGIACEFFGRKKGVPFDIELRQLLSNAIKEGTFLDIWEDVFSFLLGKQCKKEFLAIAVDAGATIAQENELWPSFSYNTEIMSQFRKQLPKIAQKPYLLYSLKEWNQKYRGLEASSSDFEVWCNAELAFVNNIS